MLQWINKKNNKIKRTAIFFTGVMLVAVFLLFLFGVDGVNAQEGVNIVSVADPNSQLQEGVQIIEEPLGLPATDIRLIIARIIRAALGLMGIVLVVIMIYGGYLWMTAGGNENQIDKAKKVLLNAVIGLVIILSAYAIVAFIMRMLGVGAGVGGDGGIVAPPGTQNFQGSGALGKTIKDHYPARNQKGVPRNTKIAITFFKPIKTNDTDLIVDTNDNGKFGDCIVPVDDAINWSEDCDALNTSTIKIERVNQVFDPVTSSTQDVFTPISGAAVLASYVSSTAFDYQVVYTLIIRPYEYLGSDTEDVRYRVYLTNDIKIEDPANDNPALFSGSNPQYYYWYFTCSTLLDLSPPHVIDVYPGAGSTEVKNTVIQIVFDEPIDPMGVQGGFDISGDESFYVLQNGGYIFLKSDESTIPQGGFNLLSNYTILEFSSTIACGKNACGDNIYCLPVCDEEGAECDEDSYEVLLRAAWTNSTSTFEAIPFSGIADMSGNALDGNDDMMAQKAPRTEPVFDNQNVPDNYYWNFNLNDELDLTSPFINQIVPGPEATKVAPEKEWIMWFSKRMRVNSMYSISIQESPTPEERCELLELSEQNCVLDTIWHVPHILLSNTSTQTTMEHGPFLDGLTQIYAPYANSQLQDAHYNCLYPGQGPEHDIDGGYTDDDTDYSSFCNGVSSCCIKPDDEIEDDFCCSGKEMGLGETASSDCYDGLKLYFE